MTIRNKLLLRLFLVSSIPLIALVIIAYFSVYRTRIESVFELENSVAVQASFRIEKWIKDKAVLLTTTIIAPGIESLDEISDEQQEALLITFLQNDASIEEVAFIDLSGQMRKRFKKGGIEIEPETANFRDAEGFKAAMQGNTFLGEILFEEKAIGLVAPVTNQAKKIIAVFVGAISLKTTQDILQEFKIGESGYLYVVDQEGNMIAHSWQQPDLIGKNFSDNEGISQFLESHSAAKGEYAGILGKKVLGTILPIPNIYWGVGVEWPKSEVMEVVIAIFLQILLISSIVLAAILTAAFIFASQISNPVKAIQEGAKIIGSGNFQYKINIQTKDELEELGRAFNEMTKGLKELSDLKDEMVFIAAHELRSPVTKICWYFSALLEDPAVKLEPDIRNHLEGIYEASQRLNRLIDEILEVARVEGGRIEVKVSPQDISQVIAQVVGEYQRKAQEKNLALVYNFDPGLPKVLADAGKIREIIINLIENAIKCTSAGQIAISHDLKEKGLMTRVSDTGIGMTEEELNHLFEKFFQTKTSKRHEIPGTGLGLFIIKQLLEKMSGSIWAESELGKGTTFCFVLPIAES